MPPLSRPIMDLPVRKPKTAGSRKKTATKKRKSAFECDDEVKYLTSRALYADSGSTSGDSFEYLGSMPRYRQDSEDEAAPPARKKSKISPAKSEEKRLRILRKVPPASFLVKLERATSQRMFVIERRPGGTDEVPEELIVVAGTTGNLYDVIIGLEPSCTCPDYMGGNECKHIIYVLHNVLKAPAHLQYQPALLSSELREIFSHAPIPQSCLEQDFGHPSRESNNRKEISGDCPICFTEFQPESEEILWCKGACGNNIHKTCFEEWAKSQKNSRSEVRCVFCRTPWRGDQDSIQRIQDKGRVNSEGYVNIGKELGLSGNRDTSTYNFGYSRKRRRRSDYNDDFEEDEDDY